jgi:hypothetical protein
MILITGRVSLRPDPFPSAVARDLRARGSEDDRTRVSGSPSHRARRPAVDGHPGGTP